LPDTATGRRTVLIALHWPNEAIKRGQAEQVESTSQSWTG
jgi:hypothetical protein